MENDYSSLIIKPLDWCLIQYLTGVDLGTSYESIEECFRLLLKQYILFFDVTTISSRDKKRLLIEFMDLLQNFQNKENQINQILLKFLDHKPSDDLVFRSLQIFTFNWIENKINTLDIIENFIAMNNESVWPLSVAIMKKILDFRG